MKFEMKEEIVVPVEHGRYFLIEYDARHREYSIFEKISHIAAPLPKDGKCAGVIVVTLAGNFTPDEDYQVFDFAEDELPDEANEDFAKYYEHYRQFNLQ